MNSSANARSPISTAVSCGLSLANGRPGPDACSTLPLRICVARLPLAREIPRADILLEHSRQSYGFREGAMADAWRLRHRPCQSFFRLGARGGYFAVACAARADWRAG